MTKIRIDSATSSIEPSSIIKPRSIRNPNRVHFTSRLRAHSLCIRSLLQRAFFDEFLHAFLKRFHSRHTPFAAAFATFRTPSTSGTFFQLRPRFFVTCTERPPSEMSHHGQPPLEIQINSEEGFCSSTTSSRPHVASKASQRREAGAHPYQFTSACFAYMVPPQFCGCRQRRHVCSSRLRDRQ